MPYFIELALRSERSPLMRMVMSLNPVRDIATCKSLKQEVTVILTSNIRQQV